MLLCCVSQVDLQLPSQLQVDAASVRKLQWLIGRLRFQGRSLLAMQEERARLLHAVRKSPANQQFQLNTVLICV